MRLVIDASVAIKWLVEEDLHEKARHLLAGNDLFFAPDFLAIEMANVAWKKVRRQEIDAAQAREIAISHQDGEPTLVPSTPLIERATQIALALDHPVYDCLYLACAEAVDGELITDDMRLCRAIEGSTYETLVQPLATAATR